MMLEGLIRHGGFNYDTKANDFEYRSITLQHDLNFGVSIPNLLLGILPPFIQIQHV